MVKPKDSLYPLGIICQDWSRGLEVTSGQLKGVKLGISKIAKYNSSWMLRAIGNELRYWPDLPLIRSTKRTPLFNASTYNFEHSETSDEDNKMTDFYAGGGASKAPKTYAGAVRRQTSASSKKTADDSSVAKVTCPVCHKGVPQDDINAHVDLCLKD